MVIMVQGGKGAEWQRHQALMMRGVKTLGSKCAAVTVRCDEAAGQRGKGWERTRLSPQIAEWYLY